MRPAPGVPVCLAAGPLVAYERAVVLTRLEAVFHAFRGYETVDVPSVRIHTGAHIPVIGLGTWKVGRWSAALTYSHLSRRPCVLAQKHPCSVLAQLARPPG